MVIKRFEYWSMVGKKWSKWFYWNGDTNEKWQLNKKLRNEFREVSEDEWLKIEKEQEE